LTARLKIMACAASSPAMPKRSQVRASRSFSAGDASPSQEEGWQQADMAGSLAEQGARGKDRQGLISGLFFSNNDI